MNTTKFAALRLIRTDCLLVKEPTSPVCLKLNLTDPLSDAQMRILALASPWNPLIIDAQTGAWNNRVQALDAEIVAIETRAKEPNPKSRITLRWGLVKRKRGFISHD